MWTGNSERKKEINQDKGKGQKKDSFVEFGLRFRNNMAFPN